MKKIVMNCLNLRSLPISVCALTLAVLGAGCKDVDRSPDPEDVSQAQTPSHSEEADLVFTKQDQNPQAFISTIGHAHHYEIASAQIALERTRSNQVREFARKMLVDHQQLNADLQKTVQADSSLIFPKTPSAQQQSNVAALRDASNFDTLYFQQQRRAHEEILGVLRRFAVAGSPPPLKDYASRAAQLVTQHHQAIRQIETTTNPNALKEVPQR